MANIFRVYAHIIQIYRFCLNMFEVCTTLIKYVAPTAKQVRHISSMFQHMNFKVVFVFVTNYVPKGKFMEFHNQGEKANFSSNMSNIFRVYAHIIQLYRFYLNMFEVCRTLVKYVAPKTKYVRHISSML